MYLCRVTELNKFISELKGYKHFFFSKDLKYNNLVEDFLNDREIYYNLDSKKYILSYKGRNDKNLKKLPMPKEPLIKYLKNYHRNRNELLCAFIETYKCLESK